MPELMDKSHEEEEHKRLMKGEQWRFSSYNVTKKREKEILASCVVSNVPDDHRNTPLSVRLASLPPPISPF